MGFLGVERKDSSNLEDGSNVVVQMAKPQVTPTL